MNTRLPLGGTTFGPTNPRRLTAMLGSAMSSRDKAP